MVDKIEATFNKGLLTADQKTLALDMLCCGKILKSILIEETEENAAKLIQSSILGNNFNSVYCML